MRRDTTKPQVGFGARLPREHKDTVEGKLPMLGGKTFLVTTALEQFLDVCETHPPIQRWVHEEIDRMLSSADGAPRGVEETVVQIPSSLYERFNSLFPEFGATTWFMRQLARAYAEDEGESLEEAIHRVVLKVLEPASQTAT